MKAYTQAAFCKWAVPAFPAHPYFPGSSAHGYSARSPSGVSSMPFCMADKQLGTHIVFHGTDHLAYIGLGSKKQLCGLAERTCFCAGRKILDLFDIQHNLTPVSLQRSKTSGSDCKTHLFRYKYAY